MISSGRSTPVRALHPDPHSCARPVVNFAASAYLGIARHPGYLLGLAVLTGLRSRFDLVLLDDAAHYNLRDAAAASGAIVRTFAHRNCESLESALLRARQESLRAIVAVDGMCPALGTIPRLDIYGELVSEHDAWLFVDESHSFGTLGANGRGAVEEYGLRSQRVLCGGSLGKAFCATGAVIVAAEEYIATLRTAPCVRGASWGMPAGAAMAAASLRLVRSRPELLGRLRTNIRRLKSGLRSLGLEIEESLAPIAAFVTGAAAQMQRLQQQLLAEDIFVLHTRYAGAGPDGAIRCAVFADHTDEHIDRLLEVLKRAL